jgi:hypothetical protein
MRTLIFILALIAINTCEQEDPQPIVDWEAFKTGVIQKDISIIEKEISKLLINTLATPTSSDPIGQKINIGILVQSINGSNKIAAELFCYACIKTYPSQSEILLTTDSSGISVRRIIDIRTSEDSILAFVNIHDAYH